MALRLIEIVLPEIEGRKVQELLNQKKLLELKQIQLPDGKVLVRILLEAEQSEAVLDLLETQYPGWKDNRVVILPVQATLPREEEPTIAHKKLLRGVKTPDRINREELYEDIKNAARCSRVYLAMTVLSTIVAIVGLHHNNVAIIIGAMVIAPLLGPNMALALGTTLGDLSLLRRALLTSLVGMATVIAFSVVIGLLVHVNPALTEVASRTRVGIGDIAVGLASGCAGALAFTTGVSAILIGVMVAVALLPPLVTFGLLLGSGHSGLALGAWLLFLMNLICINLAGVITFLLQGIHPVTWWEKDHAVKATSIAIGLWTLLLAALVVLILLLPEGLI